jgi:neutral ceramidase
MGLVTLDLGETSLLLHHEVAARVRLQTGLGPDRLVLAATHTHAAPGHYFGHPAYDEFGSEVSGYDPAMVTFLADRIAAAVIAADTNRREARAAWGTRALWDLTMNRSAEPFARNPIEWRNRFRHSFGGDVDSTLAVLRVDLRDPGTGDFQPAGAFTVFAIHGTGNPAANELLDSDIQGIAARALELHIDSLNGAQPAFQPAAVNLVANGAEGDVGPDMPRNTRCQVPTLHRVRRPTGPRTPPGPELWIMPDPDSQAACLQRARGEVDFIGTDLGAAIVDLFDSLDDDLSADLEVRRVFDVADLSRPVGSATLCPPQPGAAVLSGADASYTRFRDWQLLGMIDVGFDEDSASSARDRPKGCQGLKRAFLGRLQRRTITRLLPEVAQITVAAVGDMLLVALPFEPTTVVGGMIREAALDAAGRRGIRFREALTVGLANGYNQYVATEEEYALQHYEGASTLYGPGTAAYVAALVGILAARLPASGQPSPPAEVPALSFRRMGVKAILPPANAGPAANEIDPRALEAAWVGDTLVVRWNDLHPGRLVPADDAILQIGYTDERGNAAVLWDDHRDLEVWALGSAGRPGYRWEARWSPLPKPQGDVQVVLLARPGLSRRTFNVH